MSLLVIIAGLFLLAKTKKDKLGKGFSLVSYAVIIIGTLLLLSALCGSVCKMRAYHCFGNANYQEKCCMMNHRGGDMMMHHRGEWGKKGWCAKMQKCDIKGCYHKTCGKRFEKKTIIKDDVEVEVEKK